MPAGCSRTYRLRRVSPIPLAQLLTHTADALLAVRSGRSLDDALARTPAEARAGTQALAFHVLRGQGRANALRDALASRPPPPEVDALLTVALALLCPVDDDRAGRPPYPDHTLVDQAVAAARQRQPAAAGFVNAVLRRFIRERDEQIAAARRTPEGAWNHPRWWIDRLRKDWPAHWQALLAEANRHPPMTLRVNARQCSGADYLCRLAEQGLEAALIDDPALAGQAVVLAVPCPVQQLPGFADGVVSVQDAAAQRAAPLLLGGPPLPPGARVLDACAAPGGKTAHLLELAALEVLALDRDAQRLQRVQQTLERLQLQAELKVGDACLPATWWDGRPFYVILVDAPCTASGIVRRHPDIRWLRRPGDVAALARQQGAMLDALWPLLAPGGRLLFATCSIFKAEGVEVSDAFLQRLGADAARADPSAPGNLLLLPDNQGPVPAAAALHDGFYYALIRKS